MVCSILNGKIYGKSMVSGEDFPPKKSSIHCSFPEDRPREAPPSRAVAATGSRHLRASGAIPGHGGCAEHLAIVQVGGTEFGNH